MRRATAGLDVSTIVDASLRIADADGLEGLTMRRLAADLSVTPMAIYHHVPGKDQLLDLMADESLKTLPGVDRSADPAVELRRLFTAMHRLYLAHPALAQVMAQRPMEGPTAGLVGEEVLYVLTAAGLDDDAAISALITLTTYTSGASLYRLSRRRHVGARGEPLAEIAAGTMPTVHRLRRKINAARDTDKQFTDGLTRLVDSYLGGRGSGP
ncbi:MAG: Transcriptional regulator, TetR family [Solirubrobacterales bacterium]|nr:Transcriptional regulator, TetR family [Solirubrobacterales bacterium]